MTQSTLLLAPEAVQVLAPFLRGERARFNAQFALAQQQLGALDGENWAQVVREFVVPLVLSCHAHLPERDGEVLDVGYEIALELCGRQLLGTTSRVAAMNQAWRSLLPQVPHLIVGNPRRCLGRTSNALHVLHEVCGAAACELWLRIMGEIGPQCRDLEVWEGAGFVAAWRCGVAHFRPRAREIAAALPVEIGRLALRVHPARDWKQTLQQLENLWFDPAQETSSATNGLTLRGEVGDFIGFGGAMTKPPRVFWFQKRFWVWNGTGWMNLWADAFGSTLTAAAAPADLRDESDASCRVQPDGQVLAGGITAHFDVLGGAHGWAHDAQTLVVTTPFSHRVFLFARNGN